MKEIEVSGRTVEEAVENALDKLGVDKEKIEFEVLDEGSKGLFGLWGSKMAKVVVRVKEDNIINEVKKFIDAALERMKIEAKVEAWQEADSCFCSFSGENLGILIGHRGETLDALQYLCNLAVNRGSDKRIRIILDVEGYRKRREETLARLAERLIDKVKRTGRKVILEPMAPHERRIIHTTVQEDESVSSFSEGNEPYRRVVIVLKNR